MLEKVNYYENIILSYPRSGNHLVRFFIELLSEIPTFGCKLFKTDIEIYKNIFPEKIPFNISDFDKKDCKNILKNTNLFYVVFFFVLNIIKKH